MRALRIRRDYNGTWKVEGHEDLAFSTENDAKHAAKMCLDYWNDRYPREMLQECRYRAAAKRAADTAQAGLEEIR